MKQKKRILSLLAALLLLTLSCAAETAPAPMVCPDLSLTDADGNAVQLYSFAGKPVVINFWASWCPWCLYEFPAFEEMYQRYGEEIAFVMVDWCDGRAETREKAEALLKEKGYTFPVYYDLLNQAYTRYGLTGLPCSFFLYADGSLYMKKAGAMDDAGLEKALQALLQAK